jgi:hypothetical protein
VLRPTDPRQLPELVAEIARDDDLWAAQQALSIAMRRRDFEHPENMRSWIDGATLWWIDADACDLVEHAAPSMPAVTLTTDLMPGPAGFLAFARSLSGMSEVEDQTLMVDYIFWYPTVVEDHESISIVCWHQIEVGGQHFPVALGRSDWPFGHDTDEPYPDNVLERALGVVPDATVTQAMASIVEDRRWLATIWQLASQKGLTASREARADRASHKRILRMGGTPSPVRVINLPRHERAATTTTGSSRHYRHRWTVGMPDGFWRSQPYGPGRSLRNATWISPYLKGPKGAPLLPPHATVRVVHAQETD